MIDIMYHLVFIVLQSTLNYLYLFIWSGGISMKIMIEERDSAEDINITIVCNRIDADIHRLEKHISGFDKRISVKRNTNTVILNIQDILYIEVVDKLTFVYLSKEVYETDFKLYELEDKLNTKDFFRATKSLIININKIVSLSPELNRKMLITMDNGEKLYVSRQYVSSLKELLGIKGGWV